MGGSRQPVAAERQTVSPNNVAGAGRSDINGRRRPNPHWQESERPTNPTHISSRTHTTGMSTRATKRIENSSLWAIKRRLEQMAGARNLGGLKRPLVRMRHQPSTTKLISSSSRIFCASLIAAPVANDAHPRTIMALVIRPRQKERIARRKQMTGHKITCQAGSRQMSTTSFQSDMSTEAARHPDSPDD